MYNALTELKELDSTVFRAALKVIREIQEIMKV